MSKTVVSWNEPLFFILSFRTMKQWLMRLLCILGIAAAVVFLLSLRGGPQPWWSGINAGLIAGGLITVFPDLFFMLREIWVTEEAIHVKANGGKFSITTDFPFSKIRQVELIRPEAWNRKNGGMLLHLRDESEAVFGIPRKRNLETIATLLHRMKVPVVLPGWEPTTADTRFRVEDEISLANLPATTRDAVFTPMPAQEPKITPLSTQILGGLVGGGPLLVGLIGMIWGLIALWRGWGEFTVIQRSLLGIASVGGFILSFMILLTISQFIEAAILISQGRQALRSRLSPLLDVEDEDVFPVVLYNRDMWPKVISRSADFGFLQVNRRRKAIVFEGDKERWTIPLTALTAVRVEEALVTKEGGDASESRYFVVIGTIRDGEDWEIGMIRPRTAWGFDGAEQRKQRAGLLLDELRTALTMV